MDGWSAMSACTSHVCPYMSAKGIRADLHSHSARVVANIETHLHNSHKALWCILEYTYIGPRGGAFAFAPTSVLH